MLRYEPVTKENREEVLKLHVTENQKSFIESVSQCLSEADAYSVWRPVVICDGAKMVGFAMYGFFKEEYEGGRLWLDRFFIDSRYQGKGYGEEALKGLIKRLIDEYDKPEVYLSVTDEKIPAVKLYKKYGFAFNGESDINGEKVMVLKVRKDGKSYECS